MIINKNINDLKINSKIILKNEPYVIIDIQFIKPGKGQGFNKVKLRNLKNNFFLNKIFKSGESVKIANIKEIKLLCIYKDKNNWNFMCTNTYEQFQINESIISNSKKWIKAQEKYTITFWDENPISIIPPRFIDLKIKETKDSIKGNSVSSTVTKLAITETNAQIKVPSFIKNNEIIKINTKTEEYVSRSK